MKIFLFITFILAIILAVGSTIWVILLGFKRRKLNEPYYKKEFQEMVNKENSAVGKVSLKEKFKTDNNKADNKEKIKTDIKEKIKTDIKANTKEQIKPKPKKNLKKVESNDKIGGTKNGQK